MNITISDEEIIKIANRDKKKALEYYNNELRDKYELYEKLYDSSPEFYDNMKEYRMPKGTYSGRDIKAVIRTIIPDLTRLLTTKEPITITGRGGEDAVKAAKTEALCNWQLTRLNPFFTICETIFRESLITGMSVLKASWEKKREEKTFTEYLREEEIETLKNEGFKINSADYDGVSELGDIIYKVSYSADVVTKNQPVIEALPRGEFLFDPSAKSVKEAAFCIHRKITDLDYIKRKGREGIFKNTERVKGGVKSYDDDERELTERISEKYYSYAKEDEGSPRNSVVITEYWGRCDVNGDGLSENIVAVYAGDVLLSLQENTYGEYPFFVFSPYPSSFRIHGEGVAEMLADIQTTKTAFVREILENVRRNNDRKLFYRESAFLMPSQMNDPQEKYVAIGDKVSLNDVIVSEPYEPISPAAEAMINYLDAQRQFNTGISELKQGIKSENQTATEANIRYEAANAQTQMIAVNYSYTFLDLYRFIVAQNQRFIDEPQAIRLLNEEYEVSPDDLEGVFDYDVSVSMGTGTRESREKAIGNVLKILLEVAEPRGLTDSGGIRRALKKLLEENGIKDVKSYLT